MSDAFHSPVSSASLSGSLRDFRVPKGQDLLERVRGFYDWQNERRRQGVWPYSRATMSGPRSTATAQDDAGRVMTGVNFASQDYLSLSAHPAIKAVAMETTEKYGVHSAGSPALVGNSSLTLALESRIGEFVGAEHVVLFPTGWAAGYGAIRGLVRSADHIVMDALSHACLQEGANAATRNIYMHRHLDLEHCRHWLRAIREKDSENGILIVTEALFSMDSDTPSLAALQAAAREFGATLLVDVAHDLGALGPRGRGHIGASGLVGEIDIVMGSFSKTFASNGGFVAVKSRAVKEYLKYYSPTTTFSNAMSQVQAAIVLKAFDIVDSAEGDGLRRELMTNVLDLRTRLGDHGLEVYGDPSAIVAVKVGTESLGRLVSRRLHDAGLLANLVEYPAVAKGAARFRMQVMAKHSPENIAEAANIIARCRIEAAAELESPAAPLLEVA